MPNLTLSPSTPRPEDALRLLEDSLCYYSERRRVVLAPEQETPGTVSYYHKAA